MSNDLRSQSPVTSKEWSIICILYAYQSICNQQASWVFSKTYYDKIDIYLHVLGNLYLKLEFLQFHFGVHSHHKNFNIFCRINTKTCPEISKSCTMLIDTIKRFWSHNYEIALIIRMWDFLMKSKMYFVLDSTCELGETPDVIWKRQTIFINIQLILHLPFCIFTRRIEDAVKQNLVLLRNITHYKPFLVLFNSLNMIWWFLQVIEWNLKFE